jgi:hypothetical protein
MAEKRDSPLREAEAPETSEPLEREAEASRSDEVPDELKNRPPGVEGPSSYDESGGTGLEPAAQPSKPHTEPDEGAYGEVFL